MTATPTPAAKHSTLATLLRPFAVVEPSEVVTAMVMTLTVFVLLTAYYILKTAREPLILLQGGAEIKSYASAGQSLLLVPVIAAYTALARRVGRMKLLASVYLFFLFNLLIFAALAKLDLKLGVVFYLWVGIFNVTVIAQFWSFANDIYTPEQGKRLFAIIGIGSSIGAVAGARVAHALVDWGPPALMLAAAGLLVLCTLLLWFVNTRELRNVPREKSVDEEPLQSDQMIRKLTRDRYLLLIGALTLVLNWVNNTGEYLVDRTLLDAAQAHAAELDVTPSVFIGRFKSEYFSYYNIVGVVLQLFAVSRIMKVAGVRGALYFLPVVSFAGYLAVVAFPALRVVEITKVAENGIDYSLQNTAHHALFLVTDRLEKYVGKTIIDTFLMRIGDVLAALTVWAGAWLALDVRTFALVNLALVVVWGLLIPFIAREHRKRSVIFAEGEPSRPGAPAAAQVAA